MPEGLVPAAPGSAGGKDSWSGLVVTPPQDRRTIRGPWRHFACWFCVRVNDHPSAHIPEKALSPGIQGQSVLLPLLLSSDGARAGAPGTSKVPCDLGPATFLNCLYLWGGNKDPEPASKTGPRRRRVLKDPILMSL